MRLKFAFASLIFSCSDDQNSNLRHFVVETNMLTVGCNTFNDFLKSGHSRPLFRLLSFFSSDFSIIKIEDCIEPRCWSRRRS